VSDSILNYKGAYLDVDTLGLGECTMHKSSDSTAKRWWLLWFRVTNEATGQPDTFCVPVNPNGLYIEQGPGGKTWGLTVPNATIYESLPGTKCWQISPSINVLNTGDAHPGDHPTPSLWHHTPAILNVPDSDAWASGAAP
jgi:hypothetical protein